MGRAIRLRRSYEGEVDVQMNVMEHFGSSKLGNGHYANFGMHFREFVLRHASIYPSWSYLHALSLLARSTCRNLIHASLCKSLLRKSPRMFDIVASQMILKSPNCKVPSCPLIAAQMS